MCGNTHTHIYIYIHILFIPQIARAIGVLTSSIGRGACVRFGTWMLVPLQGGAAGCLPQCALWSLLIAAAGCRCCCCSSSCHQMLMAVCALSLCAGAAAEVLELAWLHCRCHGEHTRLLPAGTPGGCVGSAWGRPRTLLRPRVPCRAVRSWRQGMPGWPPPARWPR